MKTEANVRETHRQITALSEELASVRSAAAQSRQALQVAQTAAAISQGERDAMAANLAQLIAAFKSVESGTTDMPKERHGTNTDKPNRKAKE